MTTVFSKPLGDEVKALSDQIADKVSYVNLGIINKSSSASFAIESGSHILLLTTGTTGTKSMWMVTATSTSLAYLEVAKESGITISVSGTTVTISNSTTTNSSRVYAIVLNGSITTAS